MTSAARRRCTVCGGEGNHFFADHEPVYADAPSAAQGRVRGFREIAGPTRDTRTWEAKALECLYTLGALPPEDLAREDYRCAAQVYALLEVAESLRGQSHERKEVA